MHPRIQRIQEQHRSSEGLIETATYSEKTGASSAKNLIAILLVIRKHAGDVGLAKSAHMRSEVGNSKRNRNGSFTGEVYNLIRERFSRFSNGHTTLGYQFR